MTHLFAYGSLMCEDIMQEVSGCLPDHRPGVLKGYIRLRVKGHVYPGLLQREAHHVDGVLYQNVPASGWDRLDRFEGEMYARRNVSIEMDCGVRLTAETYIVRTEYVDNLEEVVWDFSEFLSSGKSKFRAGYVGYNSINDEDGI